jgi:hypothetical protein
MTKQDLTLQIDGLKDCGFLRRRVKHYRKKSPPRLIIIQESFTPLNEYQESLAFLHSKPILKDLSSGERQTSSGDLSPRKSRKDFFER